MTLSFGLAEKVVEGVLGPAGGGRVERDDVKESIQDDRFKIQEILIIDINKMQLLNLPFGMFNPIPSRTPSRGLD